MNWKAVTLSLLTLLQVHAFASGGEAASTPAEGPAPEAKPEAHRKIAGPCLQNPTSNTMTVVWVTDKNCAGWVEYGEGEKLSHKAVSTRDGLIEADRRLHRVTIRGLRPGATYRYRVVSREILDFQPYKVTYGGEAIGDVHSFTTLDPRKPEFSFIVLNDLHDKVDIMKRLLELAERKPYDLVFFNGDNINDPGNEEQVVRAFLQPCSQTFAATVPLVMVRGNHETRGRFARSLRPFLRDPDESYYGAFTHGGVRFVILDSGEDKEDTTPVYAGLVDFDRYRSVQEDWLAKEVRRAKFRKARYRVAISHIPLFGSGNGHGASDCRKKWGPLLDAGGVDLHLSAHLHRHRIIEPEDGLHGYPIIIGGAPKQGSATLTRVDVTPEELRVTVLTDDDQPAGSRIVKRREQ